jgi:predicted permease
MRELRYAVRSLRKQPVFTLAAALTLALGIGANTAIFSIVYQTLLRPLPYRDPGRLVFVWNSYPRGGGEPSRVSIPDYLDRRSQARSLEEAALFTPRTITLGGGGRPEQLTALAVTPSFFTTLGRDPMLGRAFTADQAQPGADRFVILTNALWQSRFGGDPSVVGRTVKVDGEPRTVAGVLPRDFEIPWRDVSLLVPFAFTPAQTSDDERGNEFSLMIGRLRAGATIEQLDGEMRGIVSRLIERLPERADYMRNSGFTGVATPMRDTLVGDVRASLLLLQGGVALVLLIACVNVANLLLMRASGRRRELALRISLGARPSDIVRQLVAESAVLSALGAAGGLVAATAAGGAIRSMVAAQMPEAAAPLDPAVLAFAVALVIAITVALGAVPAVAAMSDRQNAGALKDDGMRGSVGRGASALRSVLVGAEVALAVVLLVVAGLLVKGFARLLQVDPGFSASHVLTADVSLPAVRYRDPVAQRAFWTRTLDRIRAVPGVTEAGAISTLPLSGDLSSGTYTVVGRAVGAGERPPHGRMDQIAGQYFRAMGIPLVSGRLFDGHDTPESERVVIVDRYLARREFPGRPALGERLNFGSARNYTIVGVVGTIRDADLAQPAPEGRIYFDADQIPLGSMILTVKTAVGPASVAAQLRSAVQAVDPDQALGHVRTMDDWVARSLGRRRTPMAVLSVFGAAALALAAIGIYGVMAFSVAQRVRELGIRMALGADRRAILTLVFSKGLRAAGVGACTGIALSFVATRYIQSMLFAVQPNDPIVFGTVAAVLFMTAGAACYVPASRAARVDPMVALRE